MKKVKNSRLHKKNYKKEKEIKQKKKINNESKQRNRAKAFHYRYQSITGRKSQRCSTYTGRYIRIELRYARLRAVIIDGSRSCWTTTSRPVDFLKNVETIFIFQRYSFQNSEHLGHWVLIDQFHCTLDLEKPTKFPFDRREVLNSIYRRTKLLFFDFTKTHLKYYTHCRQ